MYNKINIKLSLDRGMIRIYLPKLIFDEKKYLYTGLTDHPSNRELISNVIKLMQYDWYFDKFDYSLAMYESHFKSQKLCGATIKNALISWAHLKIKEVPRSKRNYETFINLIKTVPNEVIREPEVFRAWLIENHPMQQSKRILTKVKAGFHWAVKSKIFTKNIYENVTEIRSKSKSEIDPFSKQERDTLIDAFKNSKYYSYYAPFIEFLFFTGCRPSEAIALKWEKISINQSILFDCDFVEGKLQDETKTEKMRVIPINNQLSQILTVAKTYNSDLVFPSKSGGYLDLHNLSTRAWKRTLEKSSVRDRVLYNCRHTFITLCLDEGIPVASVARWVGNSPKTIYEHYAGITKTEIPFL